MLAASRPSSEFDAIVVGAGGAGMVAAITAADRGARVLLLEKDADVASNTKICGGLVPGAGTNWQREKGVADSPDEMVSDIMNKNGGKADPDIVRHIAERSAGVIDFLANRLNIKISLYTGILHPGLSAFRLHAGPAESGAELSDALWREVCKHPNITQYMQSEVIGLIEKTNGIRGVQACINQCETDFTSKKVLLACSGFGANSTMVQNFCPEMAGAMNLGSLAATGEGIRWAVALGAATAHMSGYQGHCHANPVEGTHLGGSLPRLGALMVNLNGERFGREDMGYSEFARDVLRQPKGLAIEIFDQKIYDASWDLGVFREAVECSAVKKAKTITDLAHIFELPTATVEAEVADFNDAVLKGVDRFGRAIFGKPLTAPFYGSLVTGAMAHTQGGLKIDTTCRVLQQDGRPIQGLYAAGGTAAGISGDGPEGYLSGNGLVHAFATGLVAGEAIS